MKYLLYFLLSVSNCYSASLLSITEVEEKLAKINPKECPICYLTEELIVPCFNSGQNKTDIGYDVGFKHYIGCIKCSEKMLTEDVLHVKCPICKSLQSTKDTVHFLAIETHNPNPYDALKRQMAIHQLLCANLNLKTKKPKTK